MATSPRSWPVRPLSSWRIRLRRPHGDHESTAVLAKKNKELRKRLAAAEKKDTVLTSRLTELERQVAQVDKRLTATENRVVGIDRRILVRMGPALRRCIRRTKVN